jgi:hypothetical protein
MAKQIRFHRNSMKKSFLLFFMLLFLGAAQAQLFSNPKQQQGRVVKIIRPLS